MLLRRGKERKKKRHFRIVGQFPKGYSGISHPLFHLKFRHDKALGNAHLGYVCEKDGRI